MASFSVDITDIIFAGGRTGYKVVTISNGPSGGITARLLGNAPTHFQVAAVTANVSYRISTKTSASGGYSAYVRFQNADDSSDYVDVNLRQLYAPETSGVQMYLSGSTTTITNNTINVSNQFGSTDIFLDVPGGAGASGEVTSGSSWLSSVSQTPTDTGFLKFAASYISNIDGQQRTGTIQYTSSNLQTRTLTVIQDAGEPTETLSVTPSSISEDSAGGTTSIAVTYRGSTYGCDYSAISSWVNVSLSQIMTGVLSGTVAVSPNTSTSQRSGSVFFTDTSGSVALPITQTGIAVTLSVDKSQISYPNSGGSDTLAVSYAGTLSTNVGSMPSWLSGTYVDVDASHRTYTFSAESNASTSSRSFNLNLQDDNMSLTVPITQEQGAGFYIYPTGSSVSNSAGQVSFSYYGESVPIGNITYTGDWITNISHSTYDASITVSYAANMTSDPRTSIITVTSYNGHTAVYTLNQEGTATEQIVLSPISETIGSDQEYTSNITVVSGPFHLQWSCNESWVRTIIEVSNPHTIHFNCDVNTSSSSRTAVITVSKEGYQSATFTLTQAGTGSQTLIVNPASSSVSKAAGSVNVNVTGSSNISVGSIPTWLSYSGVSGNTYTFNYTSNTSSSSRTGVITFSAPDALSATFTLTQAGDTPTPPPVVQSTLKVYPAKLRFYREAGRWIVSFSNVPASRIGYTITYTDGSGWLSVSNRYVDSKYVSATANSGIRRRATIRFYDQNQTSNYVDVPVIQGSADGYDSIWIDYLYYPQDRDTDGNYYYRLVDTDTNYEFYRGVSTLPTGWSGVGGIDIPRITDTYIQSNYPFSYSGDWYDMNEGYITVDLYNMTQSGSPGVLDATFKYWNDWSTTNRRYDYTRSLNDPINGSGCDNMIIPFCVYYDDAATFTIVETEKNGNVNTYTLSTPTSPFSFRDSIWYGVKTLEYRQDGDVLFSYDMDHCGPGALIYRNRFGGWDSFLIEGNIIKTDNYTKQNFHYRGEYNYNYTFMDKMTDSVDINTTYEAHTSWLTDEQAERLVFHLLSSPIVYFQDFNEENQLYDQDRTVMGMIPVRLTNSSAEYKKFRNGKKLVNYTITFEKVITEKVRN